MKKEKGKMKKEKCRSGADHEAALLCHDLGYRAAAERQLNEALRENLELRNERERLRAALLQYRLKDGLGEIEALTVGDRTKLLELSRPEQNGSGPAAK